MTNRREVLQEFNSWDADKQEEAMDLLRLSPVIAHAPIKNRIEWMTKKGLFDLFVAAVESISKVGD